ncbi:unnamed protein product [Urochloa humidicola]
MSDPSSAPSKGGQAVPPSQGEGAGTGNPGAASNGNQVVPLSPGAQGTGGPAMPEPEPQPEVFDYGSIAEVVAQLKDTIDPANLMDVQAELPNWLHHAEENHLVLVDANTPADPNFAAVVGTFWTKVSSADALLQALAAPGGAIQGHAGAGLPLVQLYVMPSIPLHDANRVHEMAQGVQALPVEAAITIVNPGALASKVAAFDKSRGLLADLAATRLAAQQELAHLAEFAATKQQQSQETGQLYEQTKTDYNNLNEADKGVGQGHLNMLTAAARHFVARELAAVAVQARVTMVNQAQNLANLAEELEEAMC